MLSICRIENFPHSALAHQRCKRHTASEVTCHEKRNNNRPEHSDIGAISLRRHTLSWQRHDADHKTRADTWYRHCNERRQADQSVKFNQSGLVFDDLYKLLSRQVLRSADSKCWRCNRDGWTNRFRDKPSTRHRSTVTPTDKSIKWTYWSLSRRTLAYV